MSKDPMSAAQREAIQKAWDILTEHFDHVLLVADWDTEGECGHLCNAHEAWWHGGAITAIGLTEFAKDRLLNAGMKHHEPE